MAQINQEMLKKHHFWIVAAIVPLLILIGVLLVWSGAGNAVAAGQAKIKTAEDGITKKTPKGKGPITLLEENKTVVGSKKDKLWEYNWNEQKGIFNWPIDREGKLTRFILDPKDPNYVKDPVKAAGLKFGEKLPNDNFQYTTFVKPEVYLKAYEDEVEKTKPTQFNGSWQSILRYVPAWGDKKPESWMLWLALEDLWIQRGMLEPIRDVTKMMSEFKPVDDAGATPGLKRTFVSRIWKLELEVVTKPEGGVRYLTGKVTNLTDRLQLFGIGNLMKLNVYFDNNPVPFDFRIEGEFCEAKKDMVITYVPLAHDLSSDLNPTMISRVVQDFDARTVPVKRIDILQIGKTSNRHVAAALKQAKFIPELPVAAAGGEGGGPAPEGGAMGRGGGGPPMLGGPPGMGGSAGAGLSGLDGFFEPLKKRYLETTDQVRRVPVAIKIVADSMYIQDILTSFSNSKLRFQIAQVHYNRFRGQLTMPSGGTGYGSGGPGESGGGDVMLSGGLGGGDDAPRGAGAGGPRGGGPRGGGPRGGLSMGGPEGGSPQGGRPGGPPMMGGPPPGIGGPMMGGPPGMGGAMMGGPPGMGGFGMMSSTGLAETQATAGLVELTIYGVVSLYERFSNIPADATATMNSETPKNPDAPTNGAPTPNTPTPSTPMNPTPTTPMPGEKKDPMTPGDKKE